MKLIAEFGALLVVATQSLTAYGAGAHVHGSATLQVAVDGNRVNLDFSSPLENLVGFEHAPRNDKQKAAVRRMAERLHKAGTLFVPTPEARCAAGAVNLQSQVLDRSLLAAEGAANEASPSPSGRGPQKRSGAADKEEHAELSAEFALQCERPERLAGLEVKLFDVFPGVKRIDVQVAGGKKQASARLTSRNRRVAL